ncbi:PREDICTED: uncharacterized protein LOC109476704 isoform X1 [Branchiostoma belcheri]|uniref:Uncharacterized protein LOC109476704 isoform X1 n=2 Tax=Branchiostoma belcheri TaxID=7741 RepID=A0A6P4ZGZ1_BRABE|nr:PREDICTED: uncharacterized protein LOC109476704 isoform X1 [Branchiostoma belcheri]XP_019633274.1 PREDICTED: uncharacterized protein LOC109476704 isoform X1 [Branchiostoma belcheri]
MQCQRMAVEGQMLPLLEEEIDNLGDVMSAIRLARHHGIEIKRAKNLDDIKLSMRIHVLKVLQEHGRTERTTDDAVAVVARLIEADVTRRISLEGFYDTAATLMETLDTNIEHHLARDEFTMYYRDKLETKKAQLAAADCPILVAGETSAGKSSLLNLLLGQDLLPCSHLSSTSVICRLRYGVRRRAVAMTLDGVEKEIPLEENSDLNVLSEYVHNKQRDQPLPYKSVDIYLPINYLKSGVFLVDSPGIGESPAMTSVAMDYLSEAFAFIYVINSASAGGVQEDRLQALLQAVNSRKGEDDRPLFSPRSAIFVCNKWDLIPPSEREAVKQDTIRKLKASWPGFTTDQLFFLSTKIAADISVAGYMASDFVRLLNGIEKLLPISLRSKLQHQFRWLDYLVARVVYHSGVYVQQAKSSKATNIKLYRETEVRLNKLEKQAGHIIGKLQEFLQDRVEEGVGHLQSVLQSAHVQRMMSQWDETDLPNGEDWAALEKALETRISERLAAILSQEHFDSYLMDLESTITDEFRKEFSVIEQQLSWVEHALQGSRQDDLFYLLHDEEYTTKVHSIFNLSTGQKFAIGLMSPIWLPVGIAVSAVVAIPVLAYLDIKAVRKKLASEKHLAVYRADKVQYMQQRVSTAMQRFSEKENMCQYVQAKLRNTADFLVKLEKIIPALIEADRSLVSSLQKEERSNEQLMLTYRPIYKTFMNLQGLLSAFEYQHVRDYDISESNITQSGVEVSDGLFSMLYSVNIQRESTTEVLSCKEYRARLDADSAATIKKEEEFLRRVDHKNIAALQGVGESVRQGVRHPVLLLEQLKGSLRTELQHPFRIPALMKSLYAIPEAKAKVIQILEGLLYLHCRGLVHAELSLDTVLVSMEGEVKLTNIGLPRYVAATNDTEDAMLPSAVYLHPDVLQKGGHYESYCDMYGLGLMMWEIWYGRRVYDGESLAHLLSTLGTRRPGDSIGEPPNSHWRNIMEACWAVLPTDRMEASQCLRQMRASSQCHSP